MQNSCLKVALVFISIEALLIEAIPNPLVASFKNP